MARDLNWSRLLGLVFLLSIFVVNGIREIVQRHQIPAGIVSIVGGVFVVALCVRLGGGVRRVDGGRR